MNEDEIKSIRDIMLEMTNIQSTTSFKNSELSRRERVKEMLAYLLNKCQYLTGDEQSELDYCRFLVDKYYIENPIV